MPTRDDAPLTPAQRQARYRAKIRTKLATADGEAPLPASVGFTEREIARAGRAVGLEAALIKALLAALREVRR